MSEQALRPRIKCAFCKASLVIDPATLVDLICCSECGEEIPIDAYPTLVQIRQRMIAEKILNEQERAAALAAERERERQLRAREKGERKLQAERQAAEKREARKRRETQENREREEWQQRQAILDATRKNNALARMHATASWGAVAATVLIVLGLIAIILSSLSSIMMALGSPVSQQNYAPMLSAGSGGLLLLIIGLFWHSLLYAAEAIVAKLELILRRLPVRSDDAPTIAHSVAPPGQDDSVPPAPLSPPPHQPQL